MQTSGKIMIFQILDHVTTTITGDFFNLTAHDSGYPYWVPFITPYFEQAGIEIRKVPFEMLDLSKPWILSLPPKGWQWERNWDDDFMNVFSPQVKNELVKGNGYLMINHEAESFTRDTFKNIHSALHVSKINPKKIIYLVGAINPEDEYKKFTDEYGIPYEKQIKIMSSFHVHRRDFPKYEKLETATNIKKDKKFLSLNRVPRWHRVAMVSLLAKHKLLDYGYVSLGLDFNNPAYHKFHIKEKIYEFNKLYSDIDEGYNEIKPYLPLKVDDVNLNVNQYAIDSLPSIFYDKTYFSLVSSTMALKVEEPCVGFTEKEMRPILYKQPFLIHNLPYALKHLRKMGFLTFNKWIDESYDTEEDDIVRLEKLVLEVKRLCLIPDNKWEQMLKEMHPVLCYNYNILLKYNREHIFFHSDLKNLIEYVA